MIHLDPQHLKEWQDSKVDKSIIDLNVKTLSHEETWEYLFYDPQVPRTNSGRLQLWILHQWANLNNGGWWCSGLDPLNDWNPMIWGRLKPNTTRIDWSKNKECKYESPYKAPARVMYFRVPLKTWELVSARYNVPMPEQITETEAGEALGFWAWVMANPQIPIVLTEGEKKAACLLTLGFAAVALPGVWMGTRKGGSGNHRLHPDLCPMAIEGRKFIILFDYESKPTTKAKVRKATLVLGQAIQAVECTVEVAIMPGAEKGIDDWVAALGSRAAKAVSALIADALSYKDYQQEFFNCCRGLKKHKPSLRINAQFLSQVLQLPKVGLIVLISYMGSGKSTLMELWREMNKEQRFLNNGHRVSLLRALAEKLKTEMYNKIAQSELSQVQALSITADSLYKLAENLHLYDCVFIDEACQYLAHLLTSKTCKDHQAEILDALEVVFYNAPLVVIADAHMDDATIDFFQAMRPEGEVPFIVQNDWKGNGRETYWYSGKHNSPIVAQICAAVWAGQKSIVLADSKKFIKKLEHILNHRPAELEWETNDTEDEEIKSERPRIWAIHSENSGSPENEEFIRTIRYSIREVDTLLASPSLGTGVDIPDYWFEKIFGVFQGGTLTATDCLQMLWRYRPNVPMHVWVAPYPPFGYRPTNATKIKQQMLETNRMGAFLIRWNKITGERGAEKDWALDAYCQIQAQRNYSLNNLRADVLSLLKEMGNEITIVETDGDTTVKAAMSEAGDVLDQQYYEGVANAELIDKRTYEALDNKEYRKPEEVYQYEKYRIFESYGFEVTPQLVKLDDGGKLIGQITALEELIAETGGELADPVSGRSYPTPPAIVTERDEGERQRLPVCFHWKSRSAVWLARNNLGLRDIVLRLFQGETFTADCVDMQQLQRVSLWAANHIKAILNLTIPPDAKPIWILAQLCQQLGLKLKSCKVGRKGEQVRYYGLDPESQAFAVSVLKYRRSKQEDKKRAQQAAQEQNEAYAARLAQQYGTISQPVFQSVSTPPLKLDVGEIQGGLDTRVSLSSLVQDVAVAEINSQTGAELLEEAVDYGAETVLEILMEWTEEMKESVFQLLKSRSAVIYSQLESLLLETSEGWRFLFR